MEKILPLLSSHKKLFLFLGIFCVFLLLFLLLFLPRKTQKDRFNEGIVVDVSPSSITTTPQKSTGSIAQASIYYVKQIPGQESEPPVYELYKGSSQGTGSLKLGQITGPLKQLNHLKDETFLYISDLGFLDRGNTIYQYDAKTRTSTPFLSADPGFQIESYLVSPEKSSLVIWEQSVGSAHEGTSQIVSVSLDKKDARRILVSETFSDQIKYPLFWSKATGTILLDSYSAVRNGKSRGVFELSTKGEIVPLTGFGVDEYSTSPVLSPDGTILAYTSYNPSASIKIPSPNVPNGILRESVRNPNQLKMYNLITGERETVRDDTNGMLFDSLMWDKNGKSLIYRTMKISGNQSTPLEYRIFTLATKKDERFAKNTNGIFLRQFPGNDFLFATRSQLFDSIGNLTTGNLGQIFDSLYLYSPFSQTYAKILTDDPVQIIGIE